MYTKLNNLFSNRTRTNSMLVIALIFVLSVFAVGCDSTVEEASAAGLAAQETAVQETAVGTTAVNNQAANNRSATAPMKTADGVDTVNAQNGNTRGNSNGTSSDPNHVSVVDLAAQADSDITDEDAAALAFMREEEKLARDVYLTLYDVWGTTIFNNIASSEQMHMDAILMLMDHYNLEDPASSNEIGVFDNANLQALYDQLIAIGSQSLPDALAVGAAIEEIDILDLDEYIAATTNSAILQVYGSLLAGSENHLRAFVPQLERESGESYIPQYMSHEQYDAIMSTAGSNGHGNSGQGSSGHGSSGHSDGEQECDDSGQDGSSHSGNEQGSRDHGGQGSNGKEGASGQMHG